jgi:hypothetical protein
MQPLEHLAIFANHRHLVRLNHAVIVGHGLM